MTLYGPVSQRDTRWANVQLGRCPGVTIGSAGCFITVAAMMDMHYTGAQIAPDVINRLANEGGLYVNGCLYPDNMLAKIVPHLEVEGVYSYAGVPADLSKLAMNDEEEVLVVVDFDHNPNDGIQTHALRAFSWDGKTLVVDDPWFGTRENFVNKYGPNLAQTIQKIVRYRVPGFAPPWKRPAPPPPAPPVVVPPVPVVVPPLPPAPVVVPVLRSEFEDLLGRVGALEAAGKGNSEFLQGIRTAWDKWPPGT